MLTIHFSSSGGSSSGSGDTETCSEEGGEEEGGNGNGDAAVDVVDGGGGDAVDSIAARLDQWETQDDQRRLEQTTEGEYPLYYRLLSDWEILKKKLFLKFILVETVGEISTVDTGEELDSEFLTDVNSLLYQTKNL